MFESKKFLHIFIAETVLPWIIAVLGIVAVYFFDASGQYYREKLMEKYESASQICMTIYRITMGYGVVLIIGLLLIGIVAFFVMLGRLLSKRRSERYVVIRPLVIWLYSGLCALGTLILMFLVIAFTYGQSV